jgi:hypothetical protein
MPKSVESTEEHKATGELLVFREFASKAALPISGEENRRPPQPDISFVAHGERRYCEMGRALDEQLEQRMDRVKSGSAEIDMSRNVCALLDKKLAKCYDVPNGERIDLLLTLEYSSDRQLMTRLVKGTGLKEAMEQGPFTRVWIYDRSYGVIGVIDNRPFQIFIDEGFERREFGHCHATAVKQALAAAGS